MDSLRELDWVPRSVRQKARQLDKTMEELTHKLGRAPQALEVAEALSLPLVAYRKLLHDASAVILVSLDDALASDNSDASALSDLAADTAVSSSLDELEDRELRAIIGRCLKELPDQEKLVLALYYYEELTLKEVGDVLGLTESRVSQIHSKAVADLRERVNNSVNR